MICNPVEAPVRWEGMFSKRTGWPTEANRLTRLAEGQRQQGELLDLTQTNPTDCGFQYDEKKILTALAAAGSLRYEPNPLGLPAARMAVQEYYASRDIEFPIENLLLTASSSEAYGHLFSLLCDTGDEVLVPQPSYPLLDLLAELRDVHLRGYPLFYDQEWRLDAHVLEAALAPKTRAIVMVNPNNPTGSFLKEGEWEKLQEIAAAHDVAVIVDEVFADYALTPTAARPEYATAPALTFVLNGLSKTAALPQMKLGWIAVAGPAAGRAAAMARLEIINDTALSVDAPIQHAAAELLATRTEIQKQVIARLRENLKRLDDALAGSAVSRLRVEGGWSVILRLPAVHTDEEWAERLVERAGVLTHPGHFYSFATESHLVLSLLPQTEVFSKGIEKLLTSVRADAR